MHRQLPYGSPLDSIVGFSHSLGQCLPGPLAVFPYVVQPSFFAYVNSKLRGISKVGPLQDAQRRLVEDCIGV